MTAIRLSAVTSRLRDTALLLAPADADPLVTGVSDDSRTTRPGDLFCAWQGTTADGHVHVSAAAAAGAAAAIVERKVEAALPQVVVRDGRRAAAIGAQAVFGDPASALRLVAVTGTNGKTTTVWMLRHLLGQRYATASIGTLGLIDAAGEPVAVTQNLTTPGPVELARTLRRLVDEGVRAIAMETSSHALHQGRVHALRFDVAVFTNLSRDHLDYHGTFEAYLAAKESLVDLVREDGWVVVNADDPAWRGVAERAKRVLRFGMGAGVDVRASRPDLTANGASFELAVGANAAAVALPLIGEFNVANALAAAAALHALDFTLGEIVQGLESMPQVPGRLERIADYPCPVLRDYAHTPDALELALAALRPLAQHRLIVLFGAGGDRDRGKRALMGAVAERGADVVIVTSDNPRSEDADAIIDEIVAGMHGGAAVRITDRRAAIAHALDMARPGDILLLAGKGHETYQIVGEETRPFDERVIVRELLGEGAHGGVSGGEAAG